MTRLNGSSRLDDRGRLVLPADFRSRLGFQPGDVVRISEEADGSLRVESRRAAAHGLIGLAGSLDHSVLGELADDRKAQVLAEAGDAARPSAAANIVDRR